MKVLFIDPQMVYNEKLLKLVSYGKDKSNCLVNFFDSSFTVEDLLNELEVGKDLIDEIKKSEFDKFLVIVNDGSTKSDTQNYSLDDGAKYKSLKYKVFHINLDQEEVYIKDKRIKLTALEFKLLVFFVRNTKRVISRDEIIDYLWGKNSKQITQDDNLYTHIKNLKKKLVKSGTGNFIHSVYGQGYKFEDPYEVIS